MEANKPIENGHKTWMNTHSQWGHQKHSTFPIIKESKPKTTVKYYPIPVKGDIIKKMTELLMMKVLIRIRVKGMSTCPHVVG